MLNICLHWLCMYVVSLSEKTFSGKTYRTHTSQLLPLTDSNMWKPYSYSTVTRQLNQNYKREMGVVFVTNTFLYKSGSTTRKAALIKQNGEKICHNWVIFNLLKVLSSMDPRSIAEDVTKNKKGIESKVATIWLRAWPLDIVWPRDATFLWSRAFTHPLKCNQTRHKVIRWREVMPLIRWWPSHFGFGLDGVHIKGNLLYLKMQ